MCEQLNIAVIGDGAVGKTSFLFTATTGVFHTEYLPTVQEHFALNLMVDGKAFNISLLDTAGQDEYKQIRTAIYPQMDGFLLCYSIAHPTSFYNVIHKWKGELHEHHPTAPILLVGLKMDERVDGRDSITAIQGAAVASQVGAAGYMECSSKTREGVTAVFKKAVEVFYKPPTRPSRRKCIIL